MSNITDIKGTFLRRSLHSLSALIIIFYLFPATIFGVPSYLYMILFLIIVPLTIETIRLNKNTLIIGLHDYERDHVASYMWLTFGATILILFFPQQIAAPCIVATAFGDPAIGLTKPYRRRFMVLITFFICLAVFIVFKYFLLVALFAAALTFIAESFEFKIRVRLRPNLFWSRSKRKFSTLKSFFNFLFRTDDDFTMQLIPALILFLFFLIMPELMPPQILHPLPSLLPYS